MVKPKFQHDGRRRDVDLEVISSDEDIEAAAPIRVAWSDNEDSDHAYKDFQNRKIAKRKRGKKKSTDAKDRPGQPGQPTNSQDVNDDDLADFMPTYVRSRRLVFEKRRRKLKEAGLRTPPDYEDVQFSDDERLAQLKEKPVFLTSNPVAPYCDVQLPLSLGLVPASIAQWLRDYQLKGVEFLHRLFVFQAGGILGDDMGLGKTVQVIAFLTAAFGKTGDERDAKRMRRMRRAGNEWYPRVLVVCPGTLIENWKDELQRWGYWHVDVYHGTEKESALQAASAGRVEILITTYTTYRLNKDMLNSVEWDCVIADECHLIKGYASETSRAMNDVNALCRIGLTGTAIQNSYEELWVLLNWTSPGKFGPLSEWRRTVSEPLRLGQSHEATLHQLGMARKVAKALVDNLLPRFFLRRMKSLIADQLPKKSDRVVFCPLTDTQVRAYQAFLASDVVDYIRRSSDICDCKSGKKRGWCHYKEVPKGGPWQNYVFPAIVNLQKLANHLAILIPQGTDTTEKQEKDLLMLQAALPDEWESLYETRGSILHYSNVEFCGKWRVLRRLLRFWHDAGDKVLVFSHSVRLLRMLRLLFQNTAYAVSYLDGSMPYEERAREVAEFNADPSRFVFLISTKAGGVGLNIASANKVVIVDPNWNPAWDLQAQDRAYRIGQVRDVEVFRLVSAGTIEEIVYARQIYKQQQANIGYTASTERRYFAGVQQSSERKGEIFGLSNLFGYSGGRTMSVLKDIVNKTNVAESRAGVNVVDFDFDATQDSNGVGADSDSEPDLLLAGDHEDSAMANLAEMIKSQSKEGNTPANRGEEDPDKQATTDEDRSDGPSRKKPKKASSKAKRSSKKWSDPVQAILAGAGVGYTHENSEVIGSSRVEAHLSRRAEAQGNRVGVGERRPFSRGGVQSPQSSQIQAEPIDLDSDKVGKAVATRVVGAKLHSRYHPPDEVRRRHFCSMARLFGHDSSVEFGLLVESWTPEQRKEALDRFYAKRRATLSRNTSLGDVEEGVEAVDEIEADHSGGENKTHNARNTGVDDALDVRSDISTAEEGSDMDETKAQALGIKEEPVEDFRPDESTASEDADEDDGSVTGDKVNEQEYIGHMGEDDGIWEL